MRFVLGIRVVQGGEVLAHRKVRRMDEAKAALDALLRLTPTYFLKRVRETMRFKNPQGFEPAIKLLRELGLPEG